MTPTHPESIILDVLMTRMKSYSAHPIAWPGEPFTPPADRKYVRVIFLPNTTRRVTIDSDGPSRHMGIFQPTVVWPIDKGELDPREVAGAIADLFPTDGRLVSGTVSVRVMGRPSVGRSLPDLRESGDLLTPVSVEYESYI